MTPGPSHKHAAAPRSHRRTTFPPPHHLPHRRTTFPPPQIYTSAKTGARTGEIFKAIDAAAEQHRRRVSTSVMNEVLEDGV